MELIILIGVAFFIWWIIRSSRRKQNQDAKVYHQGRFKPRFPDKYRGDVENIYFRSNWELIAFRWCDLNYGVVAWASEELVIPYRMKGVRYEREYYPDLLIYFKSGETVMVEIKPNDQKINPNYENRCKWAAARAYCNDNEWTFRIWDETTIDKLRPNVNKWKMLQSRR